MRLETYGDTHKMLCEIRKALNGFSIGDCYYINSLRKTLSDLVLTYLDGMQTDREPHVFYEWADHLTELSSMFAWKARSESEGTYELYALWCLGMAEEIYETLPIPEIAEGSLEFARSCREEGYVETDEYSLW